MKSAIVVSLFTLAAAAQVPYSPCPLIGNYFPAPSQSSLIDAKLPAVFGTAFSDLVQNSGHPVYGPISANTTSFSVIYFTGSVEKTSENGSPVLFEYHHTSAYDSAHNVSAISADTKLPLSEVTMVMTVYAWLVTMGDQWDEPITKYIPELDMSHDGDLAIPWRDITVGSLAGHMSGLPRLSKTCTIGAHCGAEELLDGLAAQGPTFLPDSSPVISYTAFQVLALAIERSSNTTNGSFADIVKERVLAPLSMNSTCFLRNATCGVHGLDLTQHGEQAALSMLSSTHDLALVGHAMLSATLASAAATRRWTHRSTDTSNLRNGAGLPWEVYRAGTKPISPISDALTKTGTIGPYASYFGLVPELYVGFAILARDFSLHGGAPDLNAYADVASESVSALVKVAAKETVARYAGTFTSPSGGSIVLGLTDGSSPGLEVKVWTSGVNGSKNFKRTVADASGIDVGSLDYRLYPTNMQNSTRRQFVAVLQDKSAPVDAGTPTCITWQDVGALESLPYRFMFEMGPNGTATSVAVQNGEMYARS